MKRSFSDSSRNAAIKGFSSCEVQCMDSITQLVFHFVKMKANRQYLKCTFGVPKVTGTWPDLRESFKQS